MPLCFYPYFDCGGRYPLAAYQHDVQGSDVRYRSSASLPIRYSRARVCVLRNIYESFSEEMAAGNFIIDSLCTGISKNVIQPTKIPFKQDECYCHARLALNVRLVL